MNWHALLQVTYGPPLHDELTLPPRQKLVAIVLASAMLLVVLELVRRRKLREEYSLLWVVTALALLLLALNYKILVWVTGVIGAAVPNSTLFFGGILFLMLLCLQFSIRVSRLTYRMRSLSRRLALLEEAIERQRHASTEEGD